MTKSKGILKPLPSPSCYELVVSRCFILLNCHKVSQGLEHLSVTHRCSNVQDMIFVKEPKCFSFSTVKRLRTSSTAFGSEGRLLLRLIFPPQRCAKMKSTPLPFSVISNMFKRSKFNTFQDMWAICQPISSDYTESYPVKLGTFRDFRPFCRRFVLVH